MTSSPTNARALIAEIVERFGTDLADRLELDNPPEHQLLCRRLGGSAYRGMVVFSRWALGDVPTNPVLYYHTHHADELRLPWTSRGVQRGTRLIRGADDFQAPMLALARWLEVAPAAHGALLVDAVLGASLDSGWNRSAVQPCVQCGFPPQVDSWHQATGEEPYVRAIHAHPQPARELDFLAVEHNDDSDD